MKQRRECSGGTVSLITLKAHENTPKIQPSFDAQWRYSRPQFNFLFLVYKTTKLLSLLESIFLRTQVSTWHPFVSLTAPYTVYHKCFPPTI